MRCLKLFLIGEISRRDDCPQKVNVLCSQIPRGGGTPCHGQPRGEATEAVRRQRGERMADSFTGDFIKRNGQGKINKLSKFRVDSLNNSLGSGL